MTANRHTAGHHTAEGYRALLVPVEGPIREVTLPPDQQVRPGGLLCTALRELTGAQLVERRAGPYVLGPAGLASLGVWVDATVRADRAPRPASDSNRRVDALRETWGVQDAPVHGTAVITGHALGGREITSLTDEQLLELRRTMPGRWCG